MLWTFADTIFHGYFLPRSHNFPRGMCWFFMANGWCKNGSECKYKHRPGAARVSDDSSDEDDSSDSSVGVSTALARAQALTLPRGKYGSDEDEGSNSSAV